MSVRQIETLGIGKGGYKMRMTDVSNLLESNDLHNILVSSNKD
jgi:hypothetical protein